MFSSANQFRRMRSAMRFVDLPNGGSIFFVGSTVAGAGTGSGHGYTPDAPLTTLDAAVARCTANKGDMIVVLEGHAESLAADSGVDLDVAGVRVVGLGRGASRPTFTFTTAVTADFKLAAAGVSIENLLFVAGIDALTGPIEVSGADCAIIDCEYRDDSVNNYETTDVLTIIAGGTRCLVDGFKYLHIGGTGGTQGQSVINVAAGVDGVEICNCVIATDAQLGGIECGNATNLNIHDNIIDTSHADDVAITLGATSTGMVYRNFLKIATDAQTTWITAVNDCALFLNYGVNADAETGVLIGTVSA